MILATNTFPKVNVLLSISPAVFTFTFAVLLQHKLGYLKYLKIKIYQTNSVTALLG